MPIYAAKYIETGQPTPDGWTKFGNIAVDVSGIATPSDLPFTPGVDETYDTNGYIIISDTTNAGLVGRTTGNNTGIASTKTPTYWASLSKTEQSFLDVVNRLPGRSGQTPFDDGLSALTWLNSNGYWTSWSNTPLANSSIYYDPGNLLSYPGTGTTLINIGTDGNVSGTLGTLSGVVYESGIAGGVFNFDGGSDRITFGSYDFGNQITVTAWVYPRNEASINTLMSNAFAGLSTNGFKLEWNNWQTTDLRMLIEAGNGSSGNVIQSTNPIISENSWQFLTYVVDFTTPSGLLYQNGINISTSGGIVSGISTSADWNIGSMMGAYYMNANLGEFKLFKSLLSPSEILDEFNNTKSRYGL